MVKKDVAYIFPGQGSQYVGMGKDLYDNFFQAKELFDNANEVLGYDLKGLCFQGPMDRLSTTSLSQPAILTVSIAALRSLESRIKDLDVKAALGLSLGEYSALVSAGAIDFSDGIRLVRARGQFMEEASRERPGKMASILGLDKEAVEEICKEVGCEIANLNCPGQIVISGRNESIDKAIELAEKRGAKRSVILEVSGPFHSRLMKPAANELEYFLDNIDIKRPSFPVISNVDAKYETEANDIKKNLVKQLTNRVYWEDSIRLLAKEGVKRFLEIGPGKVLKGLLRRIDPSLIIYNVATAEDIEDLESVI